MQENFEIDAVSRVDAGKGASRRLRRQGLVPGIIYGADKAPEMFSVKQNHLAHHLDNEAFYSHILSVKLDGKPQKVILRDLQRHPAKPIILHVDFQRVSASEKLRMNIPLHFVGEELSPGVKAGGEVSHHVTEVEVLCLGADLPEYIELDVSGMEIGGMLHLADLTMPKGVELTVPLDEEHNQPVISIHAPRTGEEEEEVSAAPGEGAEAAGEAGSEEG